MLAYLYAVHAAAYAYALTLAGHTSLVETPATKHTHAADAEADCIDFSKAQDAPAWLTTPPLDAPLDGIEF